MSSIAKEVTLTKVENSRCPATGRNVIIGSLNEPELSDWDALVESSPQGTVFCHSWWLRAIEGDIRLLGYIEGRHLVAGMPLYFESRFGAKICTMPREIPYWGVIMEPFEGKLPAVCSREMRILRSFAEVLSAEKIVFQTFHPTVRNWLPFYWAGFKQTLRFTYRFEELSNLQSIWSGMDHTTQLEIRKAERQGLRIVPCDVTTVFNAERMTFQRRGLKHTRTLKSLEAVHRAAKHNNTGACCFAVVDGDGRVHTASMLTWNSNSAFLFAGGADPELTKSGAIPFLIWELIRFSAERTKVFDFGGSMIQGIEHFNRSFGAKQVPYHWVMKFPIWLEAFLMLRGKI